MSDNYGKLLESWWTAASLPVFFGIQGNRLLINHKVTSYSPCLERQPMSCQPNGFIATLQHRTGDRSFCFVTVPFQGCWCALWLSLLLYLLQSHRVGALTSNLLWKIFRRVGEGILLMLSAGSGANLQVSSLQHCRAKSNV